MRKLIVNEMGHNDSRVFYVRVIGIGPAILRASEYATKRSEVAHSGGSRVNVVVRQEITLFIILVDVHQGDILLAAVNFNVLIGEE